MAYMIPVMKNNYDIYKDTRSRKTSECSNASSGNGTTLGTPGGAAQQQQQRRRKVSECKSESFATSPSHGQVGSHRMQMQRCHSSKAIPRNASRSSHSSMMMSPTRSYAAGVGSSGNAGGGSGSSPNSSALEKQAAQQQKQSSDVSVSAGAGSSSNDYTKFHLRLVDKLRKSFRKDSGKRS